ncbi:hypothetical protein HQ571_03110 [Candidatus Kuenenbacteria bacterium]|nr:hypothetical protein [Candidatus Kuenenbacteria bacterium]
MGPTEIKGQEFVKVNVVEWNRMRGLLSVYKTYFICLAILFVVAVVFTGLRFRAVEKKSFDNDTYIVLAEQDIIRLRTQIKGLMKLSGYDEASVLFHGSRGGAGFIKAVRDNATSGEHSVPDVKSDEEPKRGFPPGQY